MSETVSLFFLLSAVCKKISKSSYQILNNQAVSFFRPYACGDWISPGQTLTFFFLPAVVFKEKHQKQLDFKTARPCFLFTSRCVCFKKKTKKNWPNTARSGISAPGWWTAGERRSGTARGCSSFCSGCSMWR